jgi:hypothetical protein
MRTDTLKITILEDGTIKTETDKVSMPNHASAEMFIRECARLAGGTTEVKNKQRSTHTQQTQEQEQSQ